MKSIRDHVDEDKPTERIALSGQKSLMEYKEKIHELVEEITDKWVLRQILRCIQNITRK